MIQNLKKSIINKNNNITFNFLETNNNKVKYVYHISDIHIRKNNRNNK